MIALKAITCALAVLCNYNPPKDLPKVSTYYENRLQREWNDHRSRTASATRFYNNWTRFINLYKGGMPAGFMAAVAQWESNGRWISGDSQLGEVGYFQISDSMPRHFGVNPSVRTLKKGNFFLAGLEYNYYAARLVYHYPHVVRNGSPDQWLLARLGFAIGWGGMTTLLERAKPRYGLAYRDLLAYLDRTGGVALGRQSADKVWFRAHAVLLQWKIGMEVAGEEPRWPQKVPRFRPYSVPKDGAMMLNPLMQGAAIASLGVIAFFFV